MKSVVLTLLFTALVNRCLCDEKDVECPELKETEGLTIIYTRGLRVGSKAQFHCFAEPRSRVGEKKVTCQEDGTWSGPAAYCHHVECPELKETEGLTITYTRGLGVGSKAQFFCFAEPSSRVGEKKVTCQEDGTWSGPAAYCNQIQCPELRQTEGLLITYTRGLRVGSKAQFHCFLEPRSRVGESKVVCQDDGSWSGPAAYCNREFLDVRCPELHQTENVRITYTDNRRVGSFAIFHCLHPRLRAVESQVICQNDGSWSGPAADCRHIQCPELVESEGLMIRYTGNRRVGSIALFYCLDQPSSRIGDPQVICQEDGSWSGPAAYCNDVRCPELKETEGLRITYSGNRRVGSIALFHCIHEPSSRIGDPRVICQEDGNWSGPAAYCNDVRCKELKETEGLRITYTGNLRVGSIALFHCIHEPRSMIGNPQVICQEDGSWSGPAAYCNDVRCPELKETEGLRITYTGNLRVGSIALFHCIHDPRSMIGNPQVFCQEDGSWSGPAAYCNSRGDQEIRCPELKENERLRITYMENRRVGSIAIFHCLWPGRRTVESQYVCNENGNWFGSASYCNQDCSVPRIDQGYIIGGNYSEQNAGYSIIPSGTTVPGGVIVFLICGENYEHEMVTCMQGQWSRELRCKPDEPNTEICGAIETDDSVLVEYVDEMKVGSDAVFRCKNPEHKMNGVQLSKCLPGGMWSERSPKCAAASPEFRLYFTVGSQVFKEKEEKRKKNCTVPRIDHGLIYRKSPSSNNWYWQRFKYEPTYSPVEIGSVYDARSEYFVRCFDNFTFQGTMNAGNGVQIYCQDGNWVPYPACLLHKPEVEFCKPIETDDSVIVEYEDRMKVGSDAVFRCKYYSANRAHGLLLSRCLPNGTWSAESPKCAENCIVPRIDHGFVAQRNTLNDRIWNWRRLRYESAFSFSEVEIGSPYDARTDYFVQCVDNFTFQGYQMINAGNGIQIYCQDGKWEPYPACLLPGNPVNGHRPNRTLDVAPTLNSESKNPSNGEDQREIRTLFFRSVTMLPVTLRTTAAQPNATFQILENDCFCTYNPNDRNVRAYLNFELLKFGSAVKNGSTIKFYCSSNRDYRLVGPTELKCNNCSKWNSLDFPTCALPVNDMPGCDPLVKPANSSIIIEPEKDNYSIGEFIEFSCPFGHKLNPDVEQIMCISGGWAETTSVPDCEKDTKINIEKLCLKFPRNVKLPDECS